MRTGGREPPLFHNEQYCRDKRQISCCGANRTPRKRAMHCDANVHALDADVKMSILQKVSAFDNFTEGDDPYGEHDFGVIEGVPRIYWKIDYYAR